MSSGILLSHRHISHTAVEAGSRRRRKGTELEAHRSLGCNTCWRAQRAVQCKAGSGHERLLTLGGMPCAPGSFRLRCGPSVSPAKTCGC